MLDSMDARAVSVVSRQIFRAPFTREKYLQYFRPLHYGERSLVQHGGNRGVEAKMAQELLQVRALPTCEAARGDTAMGLWLRAPALRLR